MGTSKAAWRLGKKAPSIEPHTLAKHRVIRRYIERYVDIVTKTLPMDTLRISFVDGYCGGGRYINSSESFPGSPLIFLSTVAEMESKLAASRSKGFRIKARYIFIDSEKRHTEYLRAEIENSDYRHLLDNEISIWTGDFNVLVDDAIQEVRKNSPKVGTSLFLLDQFGWSQVSLESIRKIMNSLQKSEVFLTFMVDTLANYISDKNYDMQAFGRIDMSQSFVKEMLRYKEEDYLGARVLIQNFIYEHIKSKTQAPYYSPFMIKSPESHRSHWFLHLSKHHEARNEIGEIHWSENNTTTHHGRLGFHALGFTPAGDIEQYMIESILDSHARDQSREAVREEIPRLIYDAISGGNSPNLIDLFGIRCSDTPVVRSIIEPEVIFLRDEGDIVIRQKDGKERPRTKTVEWTDRFELSKAPKFFGPFSKLKREE